MFAPREAAVVLPIRLRERTTTRPRAGAARRLTGAATAALVAAVLAACGGGEPAGGPAGGSGSFAWGYPTMASSLDPHHAGQFDIIFLNPIYDTLLRTDENGEFVPGLATEWDLSEDGRTLELTLREGVQFSDGAPMDAEAVRASLEHARDPSASTAGDIDVIETVEALDPTRLRLTMSEPGAHVLGALATEAGMVISPNALAAPDLARQPVGAGPYRLVSYTNDEVRYEAWDGYWDPGSVKTDRLEMLGLRDDSARLRALQSGQLDAAYLRPSQIEQIRSGGMELISRPRTLIYAVMLNVARSGLGDENVRRALMQAIDRRSIDVNLQNDGCEPTVQPFIEGYWPHVPGLGDRPEAWFDPDRARQLLAEAGHGPANPLRLTITSTNISQYQTIAEALQDQFAAVGIEAELRVVESTQSTATVRAGDFDAYVGPIDVGRPDPTTFVADYYLAGGAGNPGGFDLPGGQELLTQARLSTDTAARQEPMRQLLESAFAAGPPVVPICAPDNVIGTGNGVTGVVIPPFGTYEFRAAQAAG
ncbi:ABC transporter substrate-binding protein [Pseudonocardia kunmingensis]|uniref:Peptide/nickel transport system substrate-binding protein n=1 Tax=Pseudonocardia kunmingensis TaxID=630975 RepID=A0A543CXZ1_9PSEU|nr:ABC transporter substrate-binding protein [Pseudonocardia kunmingensis]TQM01929.1 peptide/nickel transport system substrate-binding protein [Pseudonocardia kunmingensis]